MIHSVSVWVPILYSVFRYLKVPPVVSKYPNIEFHWVFSAQVFENVRGPFDQGAHISDRGYDLGQILDTLMVAGQGQGRTGQGRAGQDSDWHGQDKGSGRTGLQRRPIFIFCFVFVFRRS